MGSALDRLACDLPGQLRLIDAATADDEQTAWLGVEGLARCKPTGGVRWVVQGVLADAVFAERAATRRAAAWGLLLHGPSDLARDVFKDALDDPDPLTRLLCLRGLAGADGLWPALAPLLDANEIAVRFEAYQLCGVLGLTAAIPALQDALSIETERTQRTVLTALARLDPEAASERCSEVSDGVLGLIDAPIPVPESAWGTLAPALRARPSSPLDPGCTRAWPRTHRRLLAPMTPPPAMAIARSDLLNMPLTPAQREQVEAALCFLRLRGAQSAVQSTLGQLLELTVDNRYRSPLHAHVAIDVAPSIKALACWLGIDYSPRAK